MEDNGGTRDNFKIDSRVSHTIFSEAPTCLPKCNSRSLSNSCLKRNVCNCKQNEKTRHFKTSSALTKFHFPSISGTKTGWICQADIQSQSSKRFCNDRTVSTHKYVPHPRLHSTSGLDVQNRPISSLFSSQHSQSTQALPTTNLQSRITRNDVPPIRVEHIPKDVLHTHKLGSSLTERNLEHEDHSVLGRFLNSKPKVTRASRARQSNYTNTTESGMANKFREIRTLPSKELDLFRSAVETMGKPENLTERKSGRNNRKSKPNNRRKKSDLKRSSENSRTTKFCKFCCTTGSAQPSAVTKVHAFPTRSISEGLPATTTRLQRSELVDAELSPINTSALPPSNKLSNNRRIGSGMGCAIEQSSFLRELVKRRGNTTLQSKGDAGHSARSSEPHPRTASQLYSNTVRQQDCSGLSTEGRRYEVTTINGNNVSNSEFTRSKSNTLQHTLYPRQVEQSCRSLITSPASSGMAPVTGLYRNSVCEVGNSSNRPLCLCESPCGLQLCISRFERPSSSISRRVQCSVALPTRVGVSTTVPNSESPGSPKSGNGNLFNSSTPMGEGVLACGPQGPSTSSTANPEEPTGESSRHVNRASTSQSREHRSRSLEVWGWSEAVGTWNTEQVSLLKNSWRKSTVKTYEVAWKRWSSWSSINNVSRNNPTGSQLAQFLSDLYLIHKLSYNTILLHKSVVSTLCNAESSSHLSSHVLVKHILKSIALANPKTTKPPVWDVSKLTTFLTTYTIDIDNFFQISRHTAMLLLLCSGRRIHDLTLLRVDPKHYTKSDDSITFWPQFGSKTDSSNFRQSGWKLLLNKNNRNLNPLFWIERMIVLLNDRRSTAKLFNLFITVRGVAKPASRTVIAGWIKTLFKEAGIAATPGSVRSAVASKSWFENHPVDEILARGNWRSANTFQQFYRRELIESNVSENVTQLFEPV